MDASSLRRRFSAVTHAYVLFPLFSVLLLAVLWGAVHWLSLAKREGAEQAATVLAGELVETYEAQVVRALREIDQTLKLLKYAHEHESPGGLLTVLGARDMLPPDLLFTIEVADDRGRILAATQGDRPHDISREEHFIAHRQDAVDTLRIGIPPQGLTGDAKLRFSRRIDKADGRFAGVVVVMVNAAYFVSGYENAKLGQQGVLGIAGTDGIFRVRRSGEAIYSGESVDYRAALEAERAQHAAGSLPSNWDGVARYMSARELFDYPVVVVAGLSQEEQLAAVNVETRRNKLWAAIASVVLIVVCTLLSRMSRQLFLARQRETEATVKHAEQVEYLAYHDGLTDLPNRALFSKLLTQGIAQAQRSGRSLVVMFLDLDRFKTINDTLGHDVGDELLVEIARRLKDALRDSDVVSRQGGDEFVMMLPDLAEARHAANVAQKILTATARPFTLLGNEFSVTASIGIAICPDDGADEQSLTKHADVAMYHAKSLGKNNFQFYSEALSADALQRLTLETFLRHALERDEFRLYYQPKRDIRNGRITGMEALLRWNHPELGLIEPVHFLALAEETGLIVPIGRWVLKTACEQAVAWRSEGLHPLSIAVNLTMRQFFDANLVGDVHAALRDSGMTPSLLELEITENLLMRDVERAKDVLSALKDVGVRITIDDFGVGYSSIATLARFPVHTVKIDRSLMRDIGPASDSDTLTAAVIAMGRSLKLNVVAQGVETKAQADYLSARACDEIQGFYFDMPLPVEEMAKLLDRPLVS